MTALRLDPGGPAPGPGLCPRCPVCPEGEAGPGSALGGLRHQHRLAYRVCACQLGKQMSRVNWLSTEVGRPVTDSAVPRTVLSGAGRQREWSLDSFLQSLGPERES